MTAPLYTALLHYPVYKKSGEVITTSITPLDLHDIARSCMTYGVKKYYVVNHLPTMIYLAGRIAGFWRSDYGIQYNRTRTDALSIMEVKEHMEDCIEDIQSVHGTKPTLIATTAKSMKHSIGFEEMKKKLNDDSSPYLLLFGTGWGLIGEFIRRCDYVLEPICGVTEYNHLSVRSAAAIILDRLCAK